MEKIKEFNQFQKAVSSDFNDMGTYARQAIDHVVKDGISGGARGYTGFSTVKTGQAQVTVANGRLFTADGSVFFRDDTGGSIQDFLTVLPAVSQRYATIVVAAPPASDTATQSREFLTDVVTRTTQAKATPTESWRQASVGYILGSEAATPQVPAIDSQYLAIAQVLLSSTGVLSVTMIGDNQLPSARSAFNAALAASTALAALQPKLATIESDISQLTNAISQAAKSDFTLRMAADVAALKAQAGLPSNYADYGADIFLNTSQSATNTGGYAATIQDGLRFPFANTNGPTGTPLVLANPIDATVSQSNGLILPSYTEYRWREISPNNGKLALNTFAYNSNISLTVAQMASTRQRFGDFFTISASSAWWLSTSNYDPITGNLSYQGQAYQAIPTGTLDPNGAKIFRVQQRFTDSASTPYWTRSVTNVTAGGYAWVQTFLQSQTVWATSLGMAFVQLDSSGPVTLGFCEIKADGTPDFGKVLSTTTVPVASLWLDGRDPNPFRRYPMQPTLLQAGKRYGAFIITAGNHWVATANGSDYLNGTLFYTNNSGYWQNDPAHNIIIDIGIAGFNSVRTEVLFNNNALSLPGGISVLDILAQSIIPESTNVEWQVNVNGVWSSFSPTTTSPLSSLPAQIGLKAILTGTNGIQPGLMLPGSQVVISRPALAMSHISTAQTIAAPTTTLKLIANLENWDPVNHSATLKVIVGGTTYTASATSDRSLGTGKIQRTSAFTVPSTATFQRQITATATAVNNLPTCSQLEHVSF